MVTPIIWTAIGAGLIAIIFFIYYNRFVRLSHQIDNSLSQIDVQLKKRSDLIPNLLSAVKGFMKHEKAIIKEVTDARKAMIGAKGKSILRGVYSINRGYEDLEDRLKQIGVDIVLIDE